MFKKVFRFAPVLVAILMLFTISCSEDSPRLTLVDSDGNGVVHLGPDPNIMGNTEIIFIPGTIQGSAIWVINGPGANVGLDIRDKTNSSFIYFADSYIKKEANVAQTGTQIPWNRWMRVRLVVYKSGLSGTIVQFIQFLGLDFFSSLEDYMIEHIYINDVYLSGTSGVYKTETRQIK
jgi:uncharacterized membrane protein